MRRPEHAWSLRLPSSSQSFSAPEIEGAPALPHGGRAARFSELGFAVAIGALLLLAYRELIEMMVDADLERLRGSAR